MIFHPGILALLLGSALTTCMLCYSAWEGVRIIRGWDLRSGSEGQLVLERRTYLVSTIMGYVMGFQLLSLFLFIHTADTLSPLFIGAMCAAGSLKVNGFGYPALMVKIVACLLAGLWLIVNATDNQAYDYPLIRLKYRLLLFITPFVLAETILQGWYLLSLQPNIITSCCSVLFSTGTGSVMSDLLAMPHSRAKAMFLLSATLTAAAGLNVYLRGKGAILFAIVALCHAIVSIIALISFVSVYFYELPTHHCPFCLLHPEYGYVGYALYAAILTGAIAGTGTGAIEPFRAISSLRPLIPRLQRKLALTSLMATAVFAGIAAYAVVSSNLSL